MVHIVLLEFRPFSHLRIVIAVATHTWRTRFLPSESCAIKNRIRQTPEALVDTRGHCTTTLCFTRRPFFLWIRCDISYVRPPGVPCERHDENKITVSRSRCPAVLFFLPDSRVIPTFATDIKTGVLSDTWYGKQWTDIGINRFGWSFFIWSCFERLRFS